MEEARSGRQDNPMRGSEETMFKGIEVCGNCRSHCKESRSCIQVHQAAVALRDWRTIFPAQPKVYGQSRSHAPVVIDVGVVCRSAEILVGVTESYRTGIRNAEQKSGKVGALGGSAVKSEATARLNCWRPKSAPSVML